MSIRKESNGKYRVSYRTGNTQHTKRFDTLKEAKVFEAKAFDIKEKVKSHEFVSFEDVYREWLNSLDVKEISMYKIQKEFDKQILPMFATKNIYEITPADCLKWRNSLEHYSWAYRSKLLFHLRAIFKHAVNFYDLPKDPTQNLPKLRKVEHPEMQFFTREEFETFIQYFNDDIVWKSFFMFLYFTGCRKGEALACRWCDIKDNTYHISRSYNEKLGGKFTSPKTVRSIRDVLLPQVLMDQLKLLHDYETEFDGFRDKDLLFFINKPLSENTIKRIKDKACAEAGVKQIRIHDFRHSHVALLINSGANVQLIAARLGHTPKETLDTYSHLFPNAQKELMQFIK